MHFESTIKFKKKNYDLFIMDGATYSNAENVLHKYTEGNTIHEFDYSIKRSNINKLISHKQCGVFFKVEIQYEDVDNKKITERILVECELTTEAEEAVILDQYRLEDIKQVSKTKIIEVL